MSIYRVLLVIGFLLLAFGCSKKDNDSLPLPEPSVEIVALQVTPPTKLLPAGLSSQFNASILMSNNSVLDVTHSPSVLWTSSNPNVASVDTFGVVSALTPGEAVIMASVKNTAGLNIAGSAKLTVTSAIVTALQVTSALNHVPQGLTRGFTATAFLSDGRALDVTHNKEITWSSSNDAIARINNDAIAAGVAPGNVLITAAGTANGQSFFGTATLIVTTAIVTQLQVTPSVSSIPVGLSEQLRAQATLSDGRVIDVTADPALTWSSSAINIASISNREADKGTLTGGIPGSVIVTASGSANGQTFSATAKVTITPAIVTVLQLTPVASSIPVGLSEQLVAQATLSDGRVLDVTLDDALSWSSSNTQVATITSHGAKKGQLTGVTPGTVTITAAGVANGQTFKATVEVTVTNAVVMRLQVNPVVSSVPVGLSEQLLAEAILSDGRVLDVTNDDALSWSIDDPTTATILSSGADKGTLVGVKPGVVTVTAFGDANGQTFTTDVQVTITGAIVTQLQVTPAISTLPAGLSEQMQAQVTLSDGKVVTVTTDEALSWSSSDPQIASILSNGVDKGKVMGVKPGVVTVKALLDANGQIVSSTAQVTITEAVITQLQVSPVISSLPAGLSEQLQAQATLSDGRVINVTTDSALNWSSSDPLIATVLSSGGEIGKVSGISPGRVIITAFINANDQLFTATAQISVTEAIITQLQVTPAISLLPVGLSELLRAQATFSNGEVLDVTADTALSWSSSNSQVATILSHGTEKGKVSGVKTGSVIITAFIDANGQTLTATAQVTITEAVITQLQITPAVSSLPAGLSEFLQAQATFSDGNVLDVTTDSALSWSSSNSLIATILSSGAEKGKVTGVIPGSVTVAALIDANGKTFTATAQVTITPAIVTKLQVTPTVSSLPAGLSEYLLAQATLSDGRAIDVTKDDSLHWSSSQPQIATVLSSGVDKGKVNAVKSGGSIITAFLDVNGQTFSATAQITITEAIITALHIIPAASSLPTGLTEQLQGQATFSDGRVINITTDDAFSWSSSDSQIATMISSGPDKGKVTGITPGVVTITLAGNVNGQVLNTTARVTITNSVVTLLQVIPDISSIPAGLSEPLQAQAIFSDNTVLDVTTDSALSWSSSDPSVATVQNSGVDKGRVTGISPGGVTITAIGNANGKTFIGTADVIVTGALVTGLTITPATITIPVGLSDQLQAHATFTDGRILDVTNEAVLSWSSSDPNIATIVSSGSDKGKVTGITPGVVTITAAGNNNGQTFTATSVITVTDPVLKSIVLSVPNINITEYFGEQVYAQAIYSDGSFHDITNDGIWFGTSDVSVVNGLVTADNFVENNIGSVWVEYGGIKSPDVTYTMVKALTSVVIGRETAYSNVISASTYSRIRFQGSAVVDGIYDAIGGSLLAGGTGGGQSAGDLALYADQMSIANVIFIEGIAGTAWTGSGGVPMLQMLKWREDIDKTVGKFSTGTSTSFSISDSIYGIIVYSSAGNLPRYVSGIRFIYK
ncbi:beta strand repeat-containing protein [Aeromonas cavernicola]|uniref:BIG2 domain-containing protein n=1 Tax=Aeromonas cavernicola TaxID=1006623 RepID=A0A2H9U9U6_9GAMM|nr:Ig-like domain-containing protein [Aeromonas cavernicola]PJG60795.1 hypothetical protein CUC53_00170 [Aeromonas cavernicola]